VRRWSPGVIYDGSIVYDREKIGIDIPPNLLVFADEVIE
jgi:hypothetical protein